MSGRTRRVLFLCTHNSARSVMAECVLNRIGDGRFAGYSAGSHPAGRINPIVLDLLRDSGFDTAALRSKSWDEFAGGDAPALDFTVTLCDDAADEVCPIWPGRPITAHWPFPDPGRAGGSEADKRAFAADVLWRITARLNAFVALPFDSLDRAALHRRIAELGAGDGGSGAG